MQKKGFISRKGQVVQVVSFVTSIQSSQYFATAGDEKVVGVGMGKISKSITPKFTGSYFEISVRWVGENNSYEHLMKFNVLRDSARVNTSNSVRDSIGQSTISYHKDNNSTLDTFYINTIDKSGSTSGVSIVFELAVLSRYAAKTLRTNRTFGGGANPYSISTSEIIIKEIAQ